MSAAPGSGGNLGMLAAEGMGELDKAPGGPTSVLHHGLMMQHDYDDPPGLYEKVCGLYCGILNLCVVYVSVYLLVICVYMCVTECACAYLGMYSCVCLGFIFS